MKILNLYCSRTGNTGKIAATIAAAAYGLGHDVRSVRIQAEPETETVEMLDYDAVFIGSGVYSWLPPQPMYRFITKQHERYAARGLIRPNSPRLPGKTAVVYATFGGPHTGMNEGLITPKFLGQLPDHLGFEVVAEWLFPGEFKVPGYTQYSVGGRLGDLRGHPDEDDLRRAAQMTTKILQHHNRR